MYRTAIAIATRRAIVRDGGLRRSEAEGDDGAVIASEQTGRATRLVDRISNSKPSCGRRGEGGVSADRASAKGTRPRRRELTQSLETNEVLIRQYYYSLSMAVIRDVSWSASSLRYLEGSERRRRISAAQEQ